MAEKQYFYWACWGERDITGEFPERGVDCSHDRKDCHYPHGLVRAGRIACDHTVGGADSCHDCGHDICKYVCDDAEVLGWESGHCATCKVYLCRECKLEDHVGHETARTS